MSNTTNATATYIAGLTRSELQDELRRHRDAGLTEIKLNTTNEAMRQELIEIERSLIECPAADAIDAHVSTTTWAHRAIAFFAPTITVQYQPATCCRRRPVGFGRLAEIRSIFKREFAAIRDCFNRTDAVFARARALAA